VLTIAVVLPAVTFAMVPTVIYSNIQTSPTSDVPGLAGAKFSSFDRPFRSMNGLHWIMSADTDLSTSEDEIILTGQGMVGNVVVREGTQAPWGASGELVGLIDSRLSINDFGHYAFATNLGGSAPSTTDEQIVSWTGAFAGVFVEGSAVPGFPTEVFGSSLDTASITNDGRVAARAPSTVGSLGSTFDDFLVFDNGTLAQEGTTVPGPQTQEAWDSFDMNDFYVSADGNNWAAQGYLEGDNNFDAILAYNNQIVVQEGMALSGFTSPVESIVASIMTPNGDWLARGDNDDQQDWVLHNGTLLAAVGDLIPGGQPGETFSDSVYSACFFEMVSNGLGDFVYGGCTSNADPDFDAVLVYNNTSVLLRQGDPVDVDGNGLFDDDAYIDIFNNDDMFLTDDGYLYFTADLRDGAGTGIGQAYMRVLVPEPGMFALLLVGGLLSLRRR
jgi:hypothetical protein